MILEPIRKKRSSEDDSFVGIRVGVLLMVTFALFGVLAFRLWFLQVLTGDQYQTKAANNQERQVKVEAPRGVIYDRNGKILVQNRAGLNVGLLPMDMYDPKKKPDQFKAEITQLASILDMSEADLMTVYQKAAKQPYITTVVKEDVAENTTVAYIKEHSTELLGVEVDAAYLRQYPFGALATHLLGYVGEASQTDLDKKQFPNVVAGNTVGKDGVERTYDALLRGTDGFKTVVVDNAGRPKQVFKGNDPTPGSNLWLTIDSDLQTAAENALIEGVQKANSSDPPLPAAGGAVVAMDPQTGQILAMASYPDYDPSLWVGGMSPTKYAELKEPQAHYPLFDRVIDGLYPAGSTFKPFVAATALNDGLITPDTTFDCIGKYTNSGTTWKCWIAATNPRGHGTLNLLQAITESCDVYFYNLGALFYQQNGPVLQDGVKKFGFGQTTGIDLPGEVAGRVPDKYWKADNGPKGDTSWKPGDEINLAIGQGDLLMTPIQEVVALSAIANGGTIYVPRVGWKISDASDNNLHEIPSEIKGTLGYLDPSILETIRQGMRQVTGTPAGTADAAFRGFPITVAGKTGTAQKKPESDYALFMGFAPADPGSTPEIAVVCVIEQGGHGSSVAAPVVRRVMEAYFHTQSSGNTNVKVTE